MLVSSREYCWVRRSSVRASCWFSCSMRVLLASRLRCRAFVVPLRLLLSSSTSFRRSLSWRATPPSPLLLPESRAAVAGLMPFVAAAAGLEVSAWAPGLEVVVLLPGSGAVARAPTPGNWPANSVRSLSGLFSRSLSFASLMLSAPLRSSSKPADDSPSCPGWARTRLRICDWMRRIVALPCSVPAVFVDGSYFVWSAIRLLTLLYAFTKASTSSFRLSLLDSTDTVTGSLSTFFRFSVTPSIMSVTLFEADVASRPLIWSFASRATCVRRLPLAPVAAVAEMSNASRPLPVAVIWKAFFAPVAEPVSCRRTPVPSVIRLALMPALLRLMASRISLTVAFSGMVMSSALRSPPAVKPLPFSSTLPSCTDSLPPPTTVSAEAKLRVATA